MIALKNKLKLAAILYRKLCMMVLLQIYTDLRHNGDEFLKEYI